MYSRTPENNRRSEDEWGPPPAYSEAPGPAAAHATSRPSLPQVPQPERGAVRTMASRAAALAGRVMGGHGRHPTQPTVGPGLNQCAVASGSSSSSSARPVPSWENGSLPAYADIARGRTAEYSKDSKGRYYDPFSVIPGTGKSANVPAAVESWDARIAEKRRVAVPMSITALIIECAIHLSVQERLANGERFARTDPMLLTNLRLVCKAWNYAALKSPRLWQNLEIDLNKWRRSSFDYSLSIFAKVWLDRARGGPLRLTITGTGSEEFKSYCKKDRVGFAGQILSICMSGNWVQWNFESEEILLLLKEKEVISQAYKMFHNPPTDPLCPDGLQQLSLTTDNYLNLETTLKGYGLFSTTCPWPHLKSLYLGPYTWYSDVRLGCPPAPLYLPTTLRFLHVKFISPDELSPFLTACPNLEELILEGSDMLVPRPDTVFAAHHGIKRLVLIKAGCGYKKSLCFILSLFTFPQLELLKLVHISYSEDQYKSSIEWKGPAIADFISRSKPDNLVLALEDSWLIPKYLLELLLHLKECSPPIRHLRVERLGIPFQPSFNPSGYGTVYTLQNVTPIQIKGFMTSLWSITCNTIPTNYQLQDLYRLYFAPGIIQNTITKACLPTIYVRDYTGTAMEMGGWTIKPLAQRSIQVQGHQYQNSLNADRKLREIFLAEGKHRFENDNKKWRNW